MKHRGLLLIISVLLLGGCAELRYDPEKSPEWHLSTYGLSTPASPADFQICIHYDCDGHAQTSLNADEWQQVRNIFSPAAADATRERGQIAAALGVLEGLVGPKVNTFADQACNNFKEPLESFQLDCVAESLNATIYLQLFKQQNLLRWHKVSHPTSRGVLDFDFPHATAVIAERDSGELYAVDSWFHANGVAAEIVPLQTWRASYWPEDACGDGQVSPLKLVQEAER